MLSSLVLSIIISWATARYVWSRRPASGAKQLALMLGLVGWWGFPFLLRAVDPSSSTRLLALKLEYISIVAVPSLWLWFALVYTDKKAWLTLKRVVLLTIVPCITLVLALTSEMHNLIVDFRAIPLNFEGPAYVYWMH